MTDEPLPPDEDTAPPADPFEAELVAYLDGELEPVAARKVENRLATDAAAREKAAALKKTYDLLDYLPKPEPSPTFTSRTLERLPVSKSTPTQPIVEPPPAQGSQPIPAPTVMSSSGIPLAVAVSSASGMQFVAPPSRWGSWAAGVLLAAVVCGAAGYFASVALSPHLTQQPPQRETPADELASTDHAIVERLPLYAGVDDIEFVRELAKPELFGDEPAVVSDPASRAPTAEPENLSPAAFVKMATAFKALPPARQQALRDLDSQLQAVDAPARDQYFRVLEVYAIWLEKLSEAERKRILSMETSRRRLDEIQNIRGQQWLSALPKNQREKLRTLSASAQAELIKNWKDEELIRREEWAVHRIHAEDIVAGKNPWPFDHPASQKDVAEFMRTAFHIEEKEKCRLDESERSRYQLALAATEKGGGWLAWHNYGRMVYATTKKYERYLLPEPSHGEPITRYDQLGAAAKYFDKNKGSAHAATEKVLGKWPDFALEVHRFAEKIKGDRLHSLGPCRPNDFKEPLRKFVTTELIPGLPAADRATLASLEGKWPEYPYAVVRFAKQRDLSAPGLMLPGSPKRWEAVYGSFGFRTKP